MSRKGNFLLTNNNFRIDFYIYIVEGDTFFKELLRYPLAREGVYATPGPAFLAHFIEKVNNIVDLTVLRLAFFMGYK